MPLAERIASALDCSYISLDDGSYHVVETTDQLEELSLTHMLLASRGYSLYQQYHYLWSFDDAHTIRDLIERNNEALRKVWTEFTSLPSTTALMRRLRSSPVSPADLEQFQELSTKLRPLHVMECVNYDNARFVPVTDGSSYFVYIDDPEKPVLSWNFDAFAPCRHAGHGLNFLWRGPGLPVPTEEQDGEAFCDGLVRLWLKGDGLLLVEKFNSA